MRYSLNGTGKVITTIRQISIIYSGIARSTILFIISFLFLFMSPFPAWATFVEQFAITTKAISRANAVTADPPGILSIHYNPAGLSLLPNGKTFTQAFTLPWIMKTVKFTEDPDFEGFFGTWGPQEGQEHDPVAGKEDTNSSGVLYLPIINRKVNFLIGPTAGLAVKEPGSRWTFAVANYAPFAGGLNHKADSPVKYGGRTVYQQHLIYAAPGASYKISPNLAVGISVGVGQTALGARVHMRSPNELVALTKVLGDATKDLEIPVISELTLPPPWFGGGIGPYEQVATMELKIRDDFSPNYNLGILWRPREWFSFGVVYQSPIDVQLKGPYVFKYSEQWQKMMNWQGSTPLLIIISGMLDLPTKSVPSQSGTVYSRFTFPQRVQTGFMIKPIKRLKVELDIAWSDWSVVKRDQFTFDQDLQLLRLVKLLGYTHGNRDLIIERDFKDTINYGISLEYEVNKKLTLRLGYEDRPTSVKPERYDEMYFVPDLKFIGLGAQITKGHEIIDIGFGCIYNPSYKIPNNTSNNMNSTDFSKPVYNPYAGLNVEQKTFIYLVSVGITMPFADFIKMQTEMMHKQQEAIHHLISILNPFD